MMTKRKQRGDQVRKVAGANRAVLRKEPLVVYGGLQSRCHARDKNTLRWRNPLFLNLKISLYGTGVP